MLYDASAEYGWTWRKQAFASRHRWSPAAPETWDNLTGEVTARAVARIVNALTPDAPLVLSIDSSGGDPVAAFELYNALRAHVAPVSTIAATCHSAAVVCFLAGDNRIASRNSRFLLHGTAADPLGRPSASSLRAGAAVLADMDRAIETLICCRCRHYPGWQLKAEMEREVELDGSAALLRGIVTSIADRSDPCVPPAGPGGSARPSSSSCCCR
jgi:ATP-dependent protease ClpP protease subunit